MKAVAILGSGSQIAKDFMVLFAATSRFEARLLLYTRFPEVAWKWIQDHDLMDRCSAHGYESYGHIPHDVVINFVGVGDPRAAAEMGKKILDLTTTFDDLVLKDLLRHPSRRYIFISSGAVYGNVFDEPINELTQARIDINHIRSQDYYSVAKLYAEVKHRARSDAAIFDVRVFNVISRSQDMASRFLVIDLIRAIRDCQVLLTASRQMTRDFLHPFDFYRLVECLLESPPTNCPVDCYSREPVLKTTLLNYMRERFGLRYEIVDDESPSIDATGFKKNYYSPIRKAAHFGYQPTLSSLEGIEMETLAILRGETNFCPRRGVRP